MLNGDTVNVHLLDAVVAFEVSRSFHVLLVESDDEHVDVLSRELQRHGHAVTVAKTAIEALHTHEDASIVLLDFDLPDLDGVEVCRAIRYASDVPLIAVTARKSVRDAFRKAGF